MQHALLAQPGAQFVAALLGEDEPAHPIAVARRTPGQKGRCAGGHYGLERAPGGEEHGSPQVHPEQHGTLPLLPVQLGVGPTAAGHHSPVEVTHVVAGLVGSGLVELHAPSLEGGEVGPGHGTQDAGGAKRQGFGGMAQADEGAGVDAHQVRPAPGLGFATSARLVQRLRRPHQGTATRRISSCTKRSGVIPSASAS